MSNSTFFLATNPSSSATYLDHTTNTDPDDPYLNFQFSDFLLISKHPDADLSSFSKDYTVGENTDTDVGSSTGPIRTNVTEDDNMKYCKRETKRGKEDDGCAIAFRTKTELEILDDGYKWRKYGKKKVKSNTNPRNYYKCSSMGCKVKKRVERDKEDYRYIITTYQGVHNHESPSTLFHYKSSRFLLPNNNYFV